MSLTSANSFDDLNPFYEPGAPPPTQPILLAQTEVGNVGSPAKLLAQEEVGPQATTPPTLTPRSSKRPKTRVVSPPPTSSSPSSSTPASGSLKRNVLGSEDSDSADDAELASLLSLSDFDESDDEGLIPKPLGEAGRPGRGGYNLEEALGWESKDFKRIKKYVHTLIKAFLDPSQCFKAQDELKLNEVRDMVTKRYPILQEYTASWPAVDMIRLRLKYTAACARRATYTEREVAKSLQREIKTPKSKPKARSKNQRKK
ncbi:hypothetical protein BDN70DRAFT_939425 [Pholiota conissans]|uniref:Uncharacterized protein n=1 Tax=Pholiota conissans TaxID=109636 RepID=A0A9P5YLI9_9AGAR|nr:hypothetical protein BDN70DRAFT_939425 [Pholiota conissans]